MPLHRKLVASPQTGTPIAADRREPMRYEVIVVGAGPAGLAAALSLGRARRRTLLLDASPARNVAANRMHGFPTREGVAPARFSQLAQEELRRYPDVVIRAGRAHGVAGQVDHFAVDYGETVPATARRLLLCAGVVDQLPELPGYRELWGSAVVQCPYCHAYELSGRSFGYWAPEPAALDFAILLQAWSPSVRIFTDGRFAISELDKAALRRRGIDIDERPLVRLLPGLASGTLFGVELAGGDVQRCDVLFVRPPQAQVPLVQALQLDLDERGSLRVDANMRTSRLGISAAGDMASHAHSALAAAASGATAAHALVDELLRGTHLAEPADMPTTHISKSKQQSTSRPATRKAGKANASGGKTRTAENNNGRERDTSAKSGTRRASGR